MNLNGIFIVVPTNDYHADTSVSYHRTLEDARHARDRMEEGGFDCFIAQHVEGALPHRAAR